MALPPSAFEYYTVYNSLMSEIRLIWKKKHLLNCLSTIFDLRRGLTSHLWQSQQALPWFFSPTDPFSSLLVLVGEMPAHPLSEPVPMVRRVPRVC